MNTAPCRQAKHTLASQLLRYCTRTVRRERRIGCLPFGRRGRRGERRSAAFDAAVATSPYECTVERRVGTEGYF